MLLKYKGKNYNVIAKTMLLNKTQQTIGVWISMRRNFTIIKTRGACPECGSHRFFMSASRSYCGECGYYD